MNHRLAGGWPLGPGKAVIHACLSAGIANACLSTLPVGFSIFLCGHSWGSVVPGRGRRSGAHTMSLATISSLMLLNHGFTRKGVRPGLCHRIGPNTSTRRSLKLWRGTQMDMLLATPSSMIRTAHSSGAGNTLCRPAPALNLEAPLRTSESRTPMPLSYSFFSASSNDVAP